MLDVHPPHAPTHTWRDFFIHIATIVVGLLIALALEQSVEAIHRHHERTQLLEDLRAEAEQRVRIIPANNRIHAADEQHLRDILHAALAATPSAGAVTFVVPPVPPDAKANDSKPETAAWAAARASGAVNVLSRSEIEAWERVDYFAQLAQRNAEATQAGDRALAITLDQIGVARLQPGTTLHLTLAQRDELARGLATLIESTRGLILDDTRCQAASDAILHGAQTSEQMDPYIAAALKSMPQ